MKNMYWVNYGQDASHAYSVEKFDKLKDAQEFMRWLEDFFYYKLFRVRQADSSAVLLWDKDRQIALEDQIKSSEYRRKHGYYPLSVERSRYSI